MIIAKNHYRMLTPLHNSASTDTLKTFSSTTPATYIFIPSWRGQQWLTNGLNWLLRTWAKNVLKLETTQEFNRAALSFRKTAGPEVGCPQPWSQKHGQDQTPALSHTWVCPDLTERKPLACGFLREVCSSAKYHASWEFSQKWRCDEFRFYYCLKSF